MPGFAALPAAGIAEGKRRVAAERCYPQADQVLQIQAITAAGDDGRSWQQRRDEKERAWSEQQGLTEARNDGNTWQKDRAPALQRSGVFRRSVGLLLY